jgi:capsular polysaccharide biosynthesis protein
MLFSVKKENIIELDNEPTYFESLLYLSPISKHPFWKSPSAIQKLREFTDLIQSDKKFPERIFVSREDAKQRLLINEKDVFERLKDRDFSFIRASDYSLREKILIFKNAKVIVGVSGAGMANIVFSKAKTKILTLGPDYEPGWFFWDLACLLDFSYYKLHGKSYEVRIPKDKWWMAAKDFMIDIEEFDEVIDLILSE